MLCILLISRCHTTPQLCRHCCRCRSDHSERCLTTGSFSLRSRYHVDEMLFSLAYAIFPIYSFVLILLTSMIFQIKLCLSASLSYLLFMHDYLPCIWNALGRCTARASGMPTTLRSFKPAKSTCPYTHLTPSGYQRKR